MAKKKKTGKRKISEKETGPDFMVQVSDPKMVRKDLLETLREIIIFMQGYEKFRQIQEEKVAIFGALKNDVKDINLLIDHKLKKLLPKGKLKATTGKEKVEVEEDGEEEDLLAEEKPKKVPHKEPKNQLEALESQLKDIEGELKKVQ